MNRRAVLTMILLLLGCTLFIQKNHGTDDRKQDLKPRVDTWEIPHNRRQPPEKVMDAMGLKPGMTIGEIGAGRGRYAVWLAHRVGTGGKVYANDIHQPSLDYLAHRCRRDGISNIVTIKGDVRHPRFPQKSLDIAFMINTYHHLSDPVAVMKNTIEALKPGGILVISEHDPSKSERVSSPHSSTTRDRLIRQAEAAGYRLAKIHDFLPEDNLFIFKTVK